jgi:hypothetical protein
MDNREQVLSFATVLPWAKSDLSLPDHKKTVRCVPFVKEDLSLPKVERLPFSEKLIPMRIERCEDASFHILHNKRTGGILNDVEQAII